MAHAQPIRTTETDEARRQRLDAAKVARALARAAETSDVRKNRLEAAKASRANAMATETGEERRIRLDASKAYKIRVWLPVGAMGAAGPQEPSRLWPGSPRPAVAPPAPTGSHGGPRGPLDFPREP